ncbi:unnamed protein product [Zymoseptoria tritici ST99CH_1A5]|uniref:Ubiquitin carboxyl-terminal hydrolase n=1 Tax=Zymoseptoria tritici ST99CH_1A5 TaxID=1276529 RepID=A0A1Y6L8G0_ZYMTR|nr:unnamed protein product [Zymoseptoria tritici ST99CH_1A5]
MPERPLTIATYAAGASLAAVTLVYVFGPTFFLDDEASNSSRATRKKGVVGLANPANDCFINSVLQALAGLPELRAYLIREVHRRSLDGPELYLDLTAAEEEAQKNRKSREIPDWKVVGQQQGLVTNALKEVLDALNERPIYKKTISAQGFIRAVEGAFRTRISRSQQDAQEFLQVVVERLAEEHAAGRRVRRKARQLAAEEEGDVIHGNGGIEEPSKEEDDSDDSETVNPLEGKLESQVECSHCQFKPKPSISSFLTLTLNVPHDSTSSTLAVCFDQLLKVEHIDDFKCDRCRLDFALQQLSQTLSRPSLTPSERALHLKHQSLIQQAIATDPEKPPKDVPLPSLSATPNRRIAKHVRISAFPKILTLHLSRSVWDPSSASSKNSAKVPFPETLPLGGLLQRKTYRLLGVVTHKGGHNSGHYESFRRQHLPKPFSTKVSLGTEGIYSRKNSPVPSPRGSAGNSPRLGGTSESAETGRGGRGEGSDAEESTDLTELSTGTSTSSSSEPVRKRLTVPLDAIPTPGLPSPPVSHPLVVNLKAEEGEGDGAAAPVKRRNSMRDALRRKGKGSNGGYGSERWWRISDEKVKECKTGDVLGMQREVYLLFYERVE